MSSRLFQRLAFTATALTLIVIVLGAWVRLTDAGLGCPDWPGCYGRIAWPATAEAAERAGLAWGHAAMDHGKALREMIHRYAAGLLGLLVATLAIVAWRQRRQPGQPLILPTLLVALVGFQAMLGMWTVTLLLKPVVVLAHLLGGMATFALLWWLTLRTRRAHRDPPIQVRRLRGLIVFALGALVVQIALGGWVSANYAALACPDLPTCQGRWWPETDFREAFVLWRGIGVDYEGGMLDQPARAAIHIAHRIGAVALTAVFAWLVWRALRTPALARVGLVLGVLLIAQILIGLNNVAGGLPLANAVAHNTVAAALLGMLVYLLHRSTPGRVP